MVIDFWYRSLAEINFDWPTFILEGNDTANYGDGSTLRIDSLLMVAGTHHYESVNGAVRTTFVLRAFDLQRLPPHFDETSSPKPMAARSQAKKAKTNESTRPLDLEDLKVGETGFLPKWPIADGPAKQMLPALIEFYERMRKGESSAVPEYLVPYVDRLGGFGVARDQCNVRVVQVLDERRVFATFTGNEVPDLWPLFVLDVGDTTDLADGSTLRVSEPVKVIGTKRYTAVSGRSPVRYVLKLVGE